MKVYTQTYSLATPSEGRFWTTQYSDIAVGLKVADALSATLTLKDSSGSTLTPEDDKINGFTIWKMKTQGTGSEVYTLSLNSSDVKFKLVRIVTDSTVFQTDEAGDPLPTDLSVTTLSAETVTASNVNTQNFSADSAFFNGCINGIDVYCQSQDGGYASLQTGSNGTLHLDNYSFTGADLKCPRLQTATLSVQYGEMYIADHAGYYIRVSDSETAEIDCIVPSFADPWEIYLEFSNGSGSATDLYFEVGFGPRVASVKCTSGKKTTIYLRSCGNSDANTLIVYKVAEEAIV